MFRRRRQSSHSSSIEAGSQDIQLRPVFAWSFRLRRLDKEMELGPDGREEHLFRPLQEVDPSLTERLRCRFVNQWLAQSGLPPSRFDDAMRMLDLRIGPDELDGRHRLRITCGFSGTTRWLYEWSGDENDAAAFIDEVAREEGHWVHEDRRLHGPTEWD